MAFVHQLLYVLTLFLSRKVQMQTYLTLMCRSIAISSLLEKILDHIIIVKALKTSNYQFALKANSPTVLCSTMVNETVQYYNTENGAKPVYVLLLDASKAFDKVAFNVLFNELRDRSLCDLRLQSYYATCIQIKSVA